MSARQAEVELAFLEAHADGSWEFALKEEEPYFSDLMDSLSHRLLYNIRKIHYQYGSGKQQFRYGYSVSDACMRWLGCLFANWTEMQEKPKEEPKEPPKEPKKIKYCVECGRASIAHLECSECNGAVCVGCLRKHTARAHPAKEEEPRYYVICPMCKKKMSTDETKTCCSHCSKIFCSTCYDAHYSAWAGGTGTSQQQARKEEAKGKPKSDTCANCHIHFYRLLTGEWPKTHEREGKTYCHPCWAKQEFDKEEPYQQQARREGWSERTYSSAKSHCQKCATETDVLYTCSSCHKADLCQNCLFEHNLEEHNPYQTRNNKYGSEWGEFTWSREEAERLHNLFGKYAGMGGNPNIKYSYQGSTSGTFTAVPPAIREAFSVLGIPPTQDANQIKKAYKALALKNHPDVGGKTEEMVRLNKAKDAALRYAGQKK